MKSWWLFWQPSSGDCTYSDHFISRRKSNLPTFLIFCPFHKLISYINKFIKVELHQHANKVLCPVSNTGKGWKFLNILLHFIGEVRNGTSIIRINTFTFLYGFNGVAAWIGYYRLLPDIIRYFLYSFKTHELLGGKNVWKYWHVLWRYKNIDTIVTEHFHN